MRMFLTKRTPSHTIFQDFQDLALKNFLLKDLWCSLHHVLKTRTRVVDKSFPRVSIVCCYVFFSMTQTRFTHLRYDYVFYFLPTRNSTVIQIYTHSSFLKSFLLSSTAKGIVFYSV